MPLNARREALVIGFAYQSLLKLDKSGKTQISPSRLDKSGKTQISPSRPSKSKKKVKIGRKGLPPTSRPLSDPRPLHGGSAPSRLGLRLAQSHPHPGAQHPRSETDQLEEQ